MSVISKAIGFFTGGSKAADDILDPEKGHLAKLGSWVGNQQFTSQEQAEFNAKLAEGVRDYAVQTMKENGESSRARRELSSLTIKFFFICLFLSGVVYPFDSEWSAVWMTIASNGALIALVGGVGLFFFGAYSYGAHVKKK
jgi:hypothetical protein